MKIEQTTKDSKKVLATFNTNDYLALKQLAEDKRTSIARVVVELCGKAIDAGFAQ